uniref:Uncharacterized protein n=1 Tax=Photinus pyralis TaxID=7054 RepID=A0A1Y1K8V3_PHOPY
MEIFLTFRISVSPGSLVSLLRKTASISLTTSCSSFSSANSFAFNCSISSGDNLDRSFFMVDSTSADGVLTVLESVVHSFSSFGFRVSSLCSSVIFLIGLSGNLPTGEVPLGLRDIGLRSGLGSFLSVGLGGSRLGADLIFDSTTLRLFASFALLAGVALGDVFGAGFNLVASPFILASTVFLGVVGEAFFSAGMGGLVFRSTDLALLYGLISALTLDSGFDLVFSLSVFSSTVFPFTRSFLVSIIWGPLLSLSVESYFLIAFSIMGWAVPLVCPFLSSSSTTLFSIFGLLSGIDLGLNSFWSCTILSVLVSFVLIIVEVSVLAEHDGYLIHSSCFSLSSPSNILCCGLLPGNNILVMLSLILAGCHTSRAHMETRLYVGKTNSFPFF